MKNKILYIITCSLVLTTSYLSAAKRGRSQLRIPTETTSQQKTAFLAPTTLDFGLFDAVVSGDPDKAQKKSYDSSQEATDDCSALPSPPFAQMNLTLPLTTQQRNLLIKNQRPPQKTVRRIITKKQKEKIQDHGLFEAVVSGSLKKVQEFLTKHQKDLGEKAINKAFIKSITGTKKVDLKPKIALLFLESSEIKKKLSGQSLDKAIIKSIHFSLKKLFSQIIEDEDLRKKLYICNKTKRSFNKALRRLSKKNKSLLTKILSHPDLKEKIKDLECIKKTLAPTSKEKKPDLNLSSTSVEDYGLFEAVISGDVKKVEDILTQHQKDLCEKAINKVFIKTVTGYKKDLKPKIALLFLGLSEVKKKLSGQVLDKAIIKSIYYSFKKLLLKIIEDESLRKKLYTNNETKESFEIALNRASTRNTSYLKKMLSYPDLKEKIKHLECIPKKMLEASSQEPQETVLSHTDNTTQRPVSRILKKKQREKIQDHGLFEAVVSGDVRKVEDILTKHQKDLDGTAINKAFIKSITGTKKVDLKPKIALLFLGLSEVKKKLSDQALDKAIIKSIYYSFKKLFSKILEDESLRKKLYTNNETKESFEIALNRASTRNKSSLKKILSYPDLKEKIKHLECIPKKMLETASQQPQETVPSQPDNTALVPVYNTQFSPFDEGVDTTHDFLTIPSPDDNISDADGLYIYTPILEEEFQPSFNELNLFPLKSLGPQQQIDPRQANNFEATQFKENTRERSHKRFYSSLDKTEPRNHLDCTEFFPLFDKKEADEPTPLPLQDTQHEQEYELTLENKIGFFLNSVKKLDVENFELFLDAEDEENSLPIISGAPLVKALEILKQHLADNDKTTKQKVCLILDELEKYEILTKKIRNYCKNKSASDPNRRLIHLVQERGRKQNASNKNKCKLFS